MNAPLETFLRLGFFFGGLILFFSLGRFFPTRQQTIQSNQQRWYNNILLTLLNSLFVRIIFGAMLFNVSIWANQHHVGLLAIFPVDSLLINVVVSFLFFDLVIYWQHRLFHRLPWLWRLHRLHHSDVEFDTTTALRFHPLEIVFSMLIKMLAVIAIGASPFAIVVFEIGLNFSAMFNHANFQLPSPLEKLARYLLITPDLHRIHHSIDKNEHHRNFGFCLSWWDYLFSSWCGTGQKSDQVMSIGLPDFRTPQDHGLWAMLRQPWR